MYFLSLFWGNRWQQKCYRFFCSNLWKWWLGILEQILLNKSLFKFLTNRSKNLVSVCHECYHLGPPKNFKGARRELTLMLKDCKGYRLKSVPENGTHDIDFWLILSKGKRKMTHGFMKNYLLPNSSCSEFIVSVEEKTHMFINRVNFLINRGIYLAEVREF